MSGVEATHLAMKSVSSNHGIRRRSVYGLKCAIAFALYYAGLLHLWMRIALRGKAVVLMYHRVLSEEERAESWSHPAIIVSTETFERHVRTLRKAFQPLTATEFLSRVENRQPFKTGSCLITFDDGWRDTFTRAWPILRRYDVPAVVFLPVDFIASGNMFWQERLSRTLYWLWNKSRSDVDFRARCDTVLRANGIVGLLSLEPHCVRAAISELVLTRKTSAGDQEELTERLSGLLPVGEPVTDSVDVFMTWDETRRMAAGGIEFGGHGTTHRMLAPLSDAQVKAEVETARLVLDRQLPAANSTFCYPNGSWSPSVANAVSEAGFRAAFSTKRGHVKPGDDRFAIKRLNIHEDMTRNTPMFLARLIGLF